MTAALLLLPATAQAAGLVIGHQTDGSTDVYANAHGGLPVRLSIVRNGQTLPGGQASGLDVRITGASAQPGDQIVVEQPAGSVLASVTYDNLPTFDGDVCAGATSLGASVGDA